MARAREAKESIIRLIHNICTALRGDYLITQAPKNAITKATKLIVSWNCKNFLIQSKMFLPHFIAVTILVKLSSSKIIPAAYLAT